MFKANMFPEALWLQLNVSSQSSHSLASFCKNTRVKLGEGFALLLVTGSDINCNLSRQTAAVSPRSLRAQTDMFDLCCNSTEEKLVTRCHSHTKPNSDNKHHVSLHPRVEWEQEVAFTVIVGMPRSFNIILSSDLQMWIQLLNPVTMLRKYQQIIFLDCHYVTSRWM